MLLIVTGKFGRTLRIPYPVGTGSKVSQPGRDHWPAAMLILLAGGGIPGGQVIGAADRIPDQTGRPIAILSEGPDSRVDRPRVAL